MIQFIALKSTSEMQTYGDWMINFLKNVTFFPVNLNDIGGIELGRLQ